MADELQTMANELQTRCNTKYSLQNGVCVKSESAVNGVCGSAHGTYYSSVPSTGHLCSAGTASSVSGSWPRTWTCAGSSGGTTASCRADVDGKCGIASGQYYSSAPATGSLCSGGIASGLTLNGSWYGSWSRTRQCAGNGKTANCRAYKPLPVNGQCNETGTGTTLPSHLSYLCIGGSSSLVSWSLTTGATSWTRTCKGSNGGASVSCTKPRKINGVCGETHRCMGPRPNQYLCLAGNAAESWLGDILGSEEHNIPAKYTTAGTNTWRWTCKGINGGTTASCYSHIGNSSTSCTQWSPSS